MRWGLVLAVAAVAIASVVAAAADPPPRAEAVVAAGDIGTCAGRGDERTAALVAREAGTVLTLGDHAVRRGTAGELARCYEPSWGRFRERTRPSPGADDYGAAGAAAYRRYFEIGRTYYAFELGSWRLYALDSERISQAQLAWLRRDLARDPHRCVLAFWHRPLYSTGSGAGDESVRPFWRILYGAGAEVILNGGDHDYERFRRLDPFGNAEGDRGLSEFVVGTGGQRLHPRRSTHPYSLAFQNETHGVLRLRLGRAGYSWRYLAVDGGFQDYGGEQCR